MRYTLRMVHPEDAKRIFDRRWRITHLYKIQTKKAEKIVFNPKPIQKLLMRYVYFGHLILVFKARQEGVSTFFLPSTSTRSRFPTNFATAIRLLS